MYDLTSDSSSRGGSFIRFHSEAYDGAVARNPSRSATGKRSPPDLLAIRCLLLQHLGDRPSAKENNSVVTPLVIRLKGCLPETGVERTYIV